MAEQTVLNEDLSAIAAQAAADPDLRVDADTGNEPVPAEPVDYHQEARDILDFALDSIIPLYPCLESVYTPDKREKLASAAARLMEKYGLTMGDILSKWWPEINFAMVVIPLGMQTVKALKAAKAAQAAEQPVATFASTQPGAMQPIIDTTDPGSLHNKA